MAILRCTCESPFQDERYGKGRRVHTYGTSNGRASDMMGGKTAQYRTGVRKMQRERGFRCCVCGRTKAGRNG